MITEAKTRKLIQSVVHVIWVYKKIVFCISKIHVYGEFATRNIRGAVAESNIILNPLSEYDTVTEAEIYTGNIN